MRVDPSIAATKDFEIDVLFLADLTLIRYCYRHRNYQNMGVTRMK